jgi:predicted ribosome quality control (RQC) complex YloA/Tae2 family protein
LTVYFKENNKKQDSKELSFENEIKKLKNIFKKQLKQKEEIEVNSEKFNSIGNKIYENYELIEKVLREKGRGMEKEGIVKKIDLKNQEIEVEI